MMRVGGWWDEGKRWATFYVNNNFLAIFFISFFFHCYAIMCWHRHGNMWFPNNFISGTRPHLHVYIQKPWKPLGSCWLLLHLVFLQRNGSITVSHRKHLVNSRSCLSTVSNILHAPVYSLCCYIVNNLNVSNFSFLYFFSLFFLFTFTFFCYSCFL